MKETGDIGCDLLEKSYLCGINNNRSTRAAAPAML